MNPQKKELLSALGVSESELDAGEILYTYLTKINKETFSSTQYVKFIHMAPLVPVVKLFLMHKLTAWLHDNTLVINHNTEN